MGYRILLRDHRGLLGIAFLAMFSSSLGQSFFIGLFQAPISERLGLTAGQFGTAYALALTRMGLAKLPDALLGGRWPRACWRAPRPGGPDATTPARGPASFAAGDGDQRSSSTGPLALRSMVVVVLPTSRWRMREWP